MNWLAAAGTEEELVLTTIVDPAAQSRTAPVLGDGADIWVCAACLNHVASEKDRFSYDGRNQFIFRNPEGIRFVILTFSRTIGCVETGVPTLAYTWFPGHAWSYCQCDLCGAHLGWYYSGKHRFVGLIQERIARALYMRN